MKRHLCLLSVFLFSFSLLSSSIFGQEADKSGEQKKELRAKAAKHQKKGNHREALDLYRKLLKDQNDHRSGNDLIEAVSCLKLLKQISELDTLVEDSITNHPENAEVLLSAATVYYSYNQNYNGFIIGGDFKRGDHRGGGQYADSTERDRIRAIQLLLKSIDLIGDPAPSDDKKVQEAQRHRQSCYTLISRYLIINRQKQSSWKLQKLSDLNILPDVKAGNPWSRGGNDPQGAPVDSDENPLFYSIPTSWQEAKNDGERWRYALQHSEPNTPAGKARTAKRWANFLHSQFGVDTLVRYDWGRIMDTPDKTKQEGILQLHTLKDNETLAQLATGVKRFTLPDDQNFIKIYQDLSSSDSSAADRLIQIYITRKQHPKAATILVKTLEQFPKSHSRKSRKELLQQITGNWGRFENKNGASPVGKEPNVDFVFRNASSVTLTVRPVDLDNMVNNLWKYLEGNPVNLKHSLLSISNLGDQLINGTRKKYLGKEIARRTHPLTPNKSHWDTRVSLSVPIKTAGAYLISALLENGVTSHTVVWLDNQVIVRKDIKDGALIYVTDGITGKPVPSVALEFFGYDQQRSKKPGMMRKLDVLTKRITRTTGKDGTLMLNYSDFPKKFQWMIRARSDQGIALHGFSYLLSNRSQNDTLNTRKAFAITDRPVYQPDQKVLGKFWVRNARYGLNEVSQFAGKKFTLTIRDAMGTKVVKSKTLTADSYGGVEYTYDLPDDAKLGNYQVSLRQGKQHVGHHMFRVEEYKKPEYEVVVDAPKEPVMLGESFKATIKANYYHGAPVTEAKVKVKVMRSRYNDLWFPVGPWDWLYGAGYGWLDVERPWYPGWKSWGCFCPHPFWWHGGGEQPEIILERELEIGPDGMVAIEIDTALAKAVHDDSNHRYSITAKVVDASRRTIVGKGSVIAARKAYQVSVWIDRGYARVGDPIQASVATRSADGKPVVTQGKFVLYQISNNDGKISEKEVQSWDTETKVDHDGKLKFKAGQVGQYRLSAKMTDSKGRTIEGAILFSVRGDNNSQTSFTYSDIELIPDKRTYKQGDTVNLLINTQQKNSTVVLSLRGGEAYQLLQLKGQSAVVKIPVTQKDMPNFFIEALTISDAQVHTAIREIIVPPEKRILNVEVLADNDRYKPRAEGKIKVRITDQKGEPVQGSLALTIYDKSLEYISGGSNVAEIKSHFWKWRRYFRGGFETSLYHYECNTSDEDGDDMRTLGNTPHYGWGLGSGGGGGFGHRAPLSGFKMGTKSAFHARAVPSSKDAITSKESASAMKHLAGGEVSNQANAPEVMIRKDFTDLIKWIGSVETNSDGVAEVPVTFPDNLTTWKIKTWAMAHGTRVGEGSTEVITSKDLIIRLQAPRFFVEKDEVVLSAIVHNYLKSDQKASISLELEGGTVTTSSSLTQQNTIKSGGETRIDWRCKVHQEGEVIVRMKVITPNDSDAMEMNFPVYVHGILKQEAWSRVIADDQNSTTLVVKVPAERNPEQTRLEVRYSPTIAGSIVDALPYLVEYPYGCTEQTLNRFLPTVITQKLIREMGINLEEVRNKRTNLNPQEIGDDKTRMAQWKRWQRNPVFSEKEVAKITRQGMTRLEEMQLSDGGWGWFSGYGEHSYPHTTAVVVHGLLVAKANGASIPDGMLNHGLNWLKKYETKETEKIEMWEKREKHTKPHAEAIDALVRLVLAESKHPNPEMLGYLFRDKSKLSVYGKSLAGMACHHARDLVKRDALIRNIMQFLVYDSENQSAHLNLGNEGYWWSWHGSKMESHAWFLKLLAATQPESKETQGLVKYLVNNRKHATYWNSTRDTAYCIEAIADYMRASGENNPNATVTVSVDGKKIKTVQITKDNLFSFDNKVVIAGDALSTGEHTIEIKREGSGNKVGPLYTNAYLTVFTKEDFIKKAGLEVKVDRAYYKLERADANEDTAGTRGQIIQHKIEKYKRIPLKPGDSVNSGDLIEVELHIHSKNDYEYLMFNDWKPAGMEAVDVRSGYTRNDMSAYMEMHHEKTSFFVRRLMRGDHSLKYRLRAEIPGSFSALPTQAEAMYAPELKANSDEMKIKVK